MPPHRLRAFCVVKIRSVLEENYLGATANRILSALRGDASELWDSASRALTIVGSEITALAGFEDAVVTGDCRRDLSSGGDAVRQLRSSVVVVYEAGPVNKTDWAKG